MSRVIGWIVIVVIFTMPTTGSSAATKKHFAIAEGKSCTNSSCHTDLGKAKYIHAPAADGGTCGSCHQTVEKGKHGFKLSAEGAALCSQCHEDKVNKKYKHAPAEAGLCTVCHNPHQSNNPKQLNFPPTQELCFGCHETKPFTAKHVHGPVTAGECIKCHDPHTSDHPKQLVAAIPDLCFTCHDKPITGSKGETLPATKVDFTSKDMKRHALFALGKCMLCHKPHVSDYPRLLTSNYPDSIYASFSKDKYICLACHNDKAYTEPRTLTETNFRNGNLNLHYRHVNRKKGRTCKTCHHHHAAVRDVLIRDSVPFGAGQIRISIFEKTETGGKCGPSCHRVVEYDRYEPAFETLRVSPREGVAATPEELRHARKQKMKK